MNIDKPNSFIDKSSDGEELRDIKHNSFGTSLGSVNTYETTSTKILGMPAAPESVRNSRESIKTHNPMTPEEYKSAKEKAIKEYKEMPQFLQYAGEMIKRDKELEQRGEWIEISKEPQRIYDAMQEEQKKKERKKQLKRKCFKYSQLILVVGIIIISFVVIFIFGRNENLLDKNKGDDVDERKPETLVCETPFRLCAFEIEELCENCVCLQSLVFLENELGSDLFENVYLIDINFISELLLNASEIRKDKQFQGLCDSCGSEEKSQCVEDEAECCFSFITLQPTINIEN
eukprot:snap_masked-scaffold_8-processed-gene-14.68-mRNA-1 protein AED:1.00 eAED:1.00 QI:0/0/0/0/1/1/2/0/288